MKRKQTLYEETAEALLGHIKSNGITVLPSIRTLARQFAVGDCTMDRAIQALASKGILSSRRGRKTRVISDRHRAAPHEHSCMLSESAQQLAGRLREDILTGKRKAGQFLPKVDYLATKLRISHRSIAQVFRRLHQEKLIHKQGKKWVIGPEQNAWDIFAEHPPTVFSDPPVILVLCKTFSQWDAITQSPRQSSFVFALFDELDSYRIHPVVCSTDVHGTDAFSPSGIDNVESYIRSLGSRYRGTIIAPHLYILKDETPAKKWLAMLARYKRPVIWCDLENVRIEHLPKRVRPASLDYRSIRINDDDAVRSVLTTLYSLGHRNIGLPYTVRTTDQMEPHFSEIRLAQFKECTADGFSHLRIVPARMQGVVRDWGPEQRHSMPEWAAPYNIIKEMMNRIGGESCVNGTTGLTRSVSRAHIKQALPFLKDLLVKEHVTAIIAPNDFFACQFLAWMKLLDIRVPRDVSIISFDNSLLIRPYPVATVDPGYSHMAYCAVHLLLQDIPIASDREGLTLTRCRIINRGSLGPPRTKKLVM